MSHQRTSRRRTARSSTAQSAAPVFEPTSPIVITDPVAASVSTDTGVIDYAPLRKDLLRVAVVLVLVSAALVGFTVTNQKTGWLDRAAGQLVHWLKLDQ